MAYGETKSSEKTDNEVWTKLDKHFTSALDHPTWTSWRKNAVKCYKYREGDQWTATEKIELDKRGQPDTVNNQVSVTINRMLGQFVKQKYRAAYRGRNSAQDDPTANTLSDLFLFIRQNTGLEYEEREMASDGFTGGFGVLEACPTFDDTFQPEIEIKAEDPFSIFPDPYSRRYDWNQDALFICRAKWLDVDEAKALYPGKAQAIEGLFSISTSPGQLSGPDSFKRENYVDDKRNRVRIVEDWYKTKEKETLYLFKNEQGQTETIEDSKENQKRIKELKKNGAELRQIDRIKHKMYCGVFAGNVVFEHKEVDRKLFPFIPYFVDRKKSGEPYSLIFLGLSMQDAINKRESKALHLLTANQDISEEGAITDEEEFAIQKAKPDGHMVVNRGYFEKFKLEKNIDLAMSQYNLHMRAMDDYRRIVGINPDALGEKSEVRSGIGIARKQAMTDIIIAPIFDNFRRSRSILAKVVLELIQCYYTEAKIFTITDDLNATRVIELDEKTIEAAKQRVYDVVVQELPDTTTMQEEQFQMLGTMLPSILPFGPFWVKKLIQLSDIRNKQEIIQEIEQQSQPPPAEPKINLTLQWTEMDPVEKSAFATKMGMSDLAEFELKQGTPAAHVIKAQTDLTKEQIKNQGGEAKIAAEQERSRSEATNSANEAGNAREQHSMGMVKAAMDMENTREKHGMEMTKKKVDILHAIAKGQKDGSKGNQDSA